MSATRARLKHATTSRFSGSLPRGSFSRGVTVLASATGLAQLVTILSSPVLTRLYTPQDFGVLSVYASMIVIISVVSSGRYEYSIPLPETDSLAASLLAVGALILAGVTAVTAVLAALFGPELAGALHASALTPYLWLVPVGVLAVGIYQLGYFWALRLRAYATVARTKLSQSLLRALTQVGLGIVVAGPVGLLLGQTVGSVAGTVTLSRQAYAESSSAFRAVTWRSIAAGAKRYIRFLTYGSTAGLLNTAAMQGLPILLAWSQGIAVAGWFGLTQRLLGLPMLVLGTAISDTFLGVAPKLAREDHAALRQLFTRTTRRMLIAASGPAIVIILFGPMLFSTIFGPAWETSGLYARYWTPAVFLQFAVSPLSQIANVLERQRVQMVLDLFRMLVVLGLFAASVILDLSASATVLCIGLALAGCYCLYFAAYYHMVRSHRAGPRKSRRQSAGRQRHD